MAERQLPTLNVAGSIPVSRSKQQRACASKPPKPRACNLHPGLRFQALTNGFSPEQEFHEYI